LRSLSDAVEELKLGDGESDVDVVCGDAEPAGLGDDTGADTDGPGPANAGLGITGAARNGGGTGFTGLENEGPSMTVSLEE